MNNPVLMAGLGTDEVALYDLPSFTLRGRIRDVVDSCCCFVVVMVLCFVLGVLSKGTDCCIT